MAVCIWSSPSGEHRHSIASATPEPAENSAGAALFPRAVGDQREGRDFAPSPLARQRGILVLGLTIAVLSTAPFFTWGEQTTCPRLSTYTIARASAVIGVTL
jgi:hypothetical protein